MQHSSQRVRQILRSAERRSPPHVRPNSAYQPRYARGLAASSSTSDSARRGRDTRNDDDSSYTRNRYESDDSDSEYEPPNSTGLQSDAIGRAVTSLSTSKPSRYQSPPRASRSGAHSGGGSGFADRARNRLFESDRLASPVLSPSSCGTCQYFAGVAQDSSAESQRKAALVANLTARIELLARGFPVDADVDLDESGQPVRQSSSSSRKDSQQHVGYSLPSPTRDALVSLADQLNSVSVQRGDLRFRAFVLLGRRFLRWRRFRIFTNWRRVARHGVWRHRMLSIGYAASCRRMLDKALRAWIVMTTRSAREAVGISSTAVTERGELKHTLTATEHALTVACDRANDAEKKAATLQARVDALEHAVNKTERANADMDAIAADATATNRSLRERQEVARAVAVAAEEEAASLRTESAAAQQQLDQVLEELNMYRDVANRVVPLERETEDLNNRLRAAAEYAREVTTLCKQQQLDGMMSRRRRLILRHHISAMRSVAARAKRRNRIGQIVSQRSHRRFLSSALRGWWRVAAAAKAVDLEGELSEQLAQGRSLSTVVQEELLVSKTVSAAAEAELEATRGELAASDELCQQAIAERDELRVRIKELESVAQSTGMSLRQQHLVRADGLERRLDRCMAAAARDSLRRALNRWHATASRRRRVAVALSRGLIRQEQRRLKSLFSRFVIGTLASQLRDTEERVSSVEAEYATAMTELQASRANESRLSIECEALRHIGEEAEKVQSQHDAAVATLRARVDKAEDAVKKATEVHASKVSNLTSALSAERDIRTEAQRSAEQSSKKVLEVVGESELSTQEVVAHARQQRLEMTRRWASTQRCLVDMKVTRKVVQGWRAMLDTRRGGEVRRYLADCKGETSLIARAFRRWSTELLRARSVRARSSGEAAEDARAQVDSIRSELKAANHTVSVLRAEGDAIKATTKRQADLLSQVHAELARTRHERETLTVEAAETGASLKDLQLELGRLREECGQMAAAEGAANSAMHGLREQVAHMELVERELNELRARRDEQERAHKLAMQLEQGGAGGGATGSGIGHTVGSGRGAVAASPLVSVRPNVPGSARGANAVADSYDEFPGGLGGVSLDDLSRLVNDATPLQWRMSVLDRQVVELSTHFDQLKVLASPVLAVAAVAAVGSKTSNGGDGGEHTFGSANDVASTSPTTLPADTEEVLLLAKSVDDRIKRAHRDAAALHADASQALATTVRQVQCALEAVSWAAATSASALSHMASGQRQGLTEETMGNGDGRGGGERAADAGSGSVTMTQTYAKALTLALETASDLVHLQESLAALRSGAGVLKSLRGKSPALVKSLASAVLGIPTPAAPGAGQRSLDSLREDLVGNTPQRTQTDAARPLVAVSTPPPPPPPAPSIGSGGQGNELSAGQQARAARLAAQSAGSAPRPATSGGASSTVASATSGLASKAMSKLGNVSGAVANKRGTPSTPSSKVPSAQPLTPATPPYVPTTPATPN